MTEPALVTPPAEPLVARHGGESMLRAVLYMCLGVCCFPFLNASAKYLGRHYPMPEVFWLRYAGHLVYCLIAFAPRRGLALFATRRPGVQAWRALLLFGSSAVYFLSLLTVELPTASAISFAGPILVTALSVPMLGEQVGWRRWTAVAVGFAGALIIIRPGSDVAQWGALLVLLNALFYALYQVLSRRVGSLDSAEISITLAGVGGVLISSILLCFSTIKLPADLLDGVVFAAIGLFGALGHYFVIKAYQWGSASAVAPVGYLELVGSTVLGYMIFAEFPDAWTWVGAAIIMASGLYITLREHKLQRERRAAAVAA
jgi:drug/metabolite transporter (DMT)-like permease